mgnify:CR=1 FL=1
MSFSAVDHGMMARALQLAERGLWTTSPNPRVGCVLVRDGEIVGEGWHEKAGEPHAEVHALRAAGVVGRVDHRDRRPGVGAEAGVHALEGGDQGLEVAGGVGGLSSSLKSG